MCLIVFAWRPGHAQPLIVAANRDEFYARPSLPLAQWPDAPQVYAGRDQEAGGTWLGVSADGRFAALTNIRDPHQPPARKSRGELVARFLSGSLPIDDYLADVNGRSIEYAGFNLLVGTRDELWHYNANDTEPTLLAAGVYGLSNAGLDTPWPKLLKAKAAFSALLEDPQPEALLGILSDPQTAPFADLPDTGVGLATESLLSSVFIASPSYGTRASTALIVNADGTRRMLERSFGPHGGRLGEVELEI
ncbi:NRDE family protein [Pseudomonas sp. P9_2]|uniref:NRDE family protein n=1 Tax=Pseudomonas sp. P9_2 TaxID=3043447 RepID=UPI002A35B5BB|nr:NRDE family protein [Pseudomonas sp. P9_2]WPN54221.1 NRDE family protein [Pseudomonas sp. P9_2]